MATFTNPTTDTSTISNAQLSSAGRTFDQDTDTWAANPGTWSNPFAAISDPTIDSSTVTNATRN